MVCKTYFWVINFYLNDHRYKEVGIEASKFFGILNNINYYGRQIINFEEMSLGYKRYQDSYNQYCDRFNNSIYHLSDLTNSLLELSEEIPDFAIQNRKLLRVNKSQLK
jgi:hypothetical protein